MAIGYTEWWRDSEIQKTFFPQEVDTGAGEDGIVQPNNPAGLVRTTQGMRLVHEGERMRSLPDGRTQVIPQAQLRQMQAQGMKGFALGGIFEPIKTTLSGIDTSAQAAADRLKAQMASASTATTSLVPPIASANTTPPALVSPESQYRQSGMDFLKGLTIPDSDYYKGLWGRALNEQGGAAAAGTGALKQEAAQAGMSKEGIGTLSQMRQRDVEGNMSQLYGNLAGQAAGIATGAAQTLASQGLAGQGQEFAVKQYDDRQKDVDWARALQFYDPATSEGLKTLQDMYVQKFGGAAPDMNVLTEERNYTKTKRGQDVTSGEQALAEGQMHLDNAEWANLVATLDPANPTDLKQLQDSWVKLFGGTAPSFQTVRSIKDYEGKVRSNDLIMQNLNIDATTFQAIAAKINSGATFDQVKDALGVKPNDLNSWTRARAAYESMKEGYYKDMESKGLAITGEQQRQWWENVNQETKQKFDEIGLKTEQFNQIYDMISKDMPLNQTMIDTMKAAGMTSAEINTAYTGLKTARTNQLRAENIAIESAEFGVDKDQYEFAAKQIQDTGNMMAGVQSLMDSGMSMTEALGVAQGIYDRSVKRGDMAEAANIALQSGDITKAGDIYNQMYGDIIGGDIDFKTLINEQNRAEFQEGMGILAQVAPMYKTYAEAEAAGVFKEAGLDTLISGTKVPYRTDYASVFNDLVQSGGDASYAGAMAEIARRKKLNETGGQSALESLFGAVKLQSDPVYQYTNSLSDETIRGMIPEGSGMTETDMRAMIGNLSLTGGLSVEMVDGKPVWKMDPSVLSLFSGMSGGTEVNVGAVDKDGNPIVPQKDPLELRQQIIDEVGDLIPGDKFNLTDAENFQKAYPNPADQTPANAVKWYNEIGFVVDAGSPTFNISNVQGVKDYYGIPETGVAATGLKYTSDQLKALVSQKPTVWKGTLAPDLLQYADTVWTGANAWATVSVGGQTGTAQSLQTTAKRAWESQIGKIIVISGNPYIVGPGLGGLFDANGNYVNYQSISKTRVEAVPVTKSMTGGLTGGVNIIPSGTVSLSTDAPKTGSQVIY